MKRQMFKKILIFLLLLLFCSSIILITQDDSSLPLVNIEQSEITINDSTDVEEYILGLKP